MSETKKIRTHVYIDGYNLYYGRLRGTRFKWLDVVLLMQRLVRVQCAQVDVRQVHYFTAPAKEAFASHGKTSVIAQQTYHRALVARHHESVFRMTLGKHSFDRNGSLLPRYVKGQPCDRSDRVRVWSLEEKQTDVNLAIAIYRDCAKGLCDQIVVCTNDSDVESALAAVRDDFPGVQIGLVTPASPNDADRRYSKSLALHAHWCGGTFLMRSSQRRSWNCWFRREKSPLSNLTIGSSCK